MVLLFVWILGQHCNSEHYVAACLLMSRMLCLASCFSLISANLPMHHTISTVLSRRIWPKPRTSRVGTIKPKATARALLKRSIYSSNMHVLSESCSHKTQTPNCTDVFAKRVHRPWLRVLCAITQHTWTFALC